MNFENVLGVVSDFFEKKNFKFSVIGGVAIAAYGLPRTTLDLDFIVESSAGTISSASWNPADTRRFTAPVATRTIDILIQPGGTLISFMLEAKRAGRSLLPARPSQDRADVRSAYRSPST